MVRRGFNDQIEHSLSKIEHHLENNKENTKMNNNEKLGIKDLLSELDEEIVFSLAATATKKAVVPTTVLGKHCFISFLFKPSS